MEPEQDQSKCEKCGSPRNVSGSGSMTQFISVCRCDLVAPVNDPSSEVDLCGNCGKRIGAGRKGSLTQFVFRSQVCQCPVPKSLLLEERQEYFSQVFEGFNRLVEDRNPVEGQAKQGEEIDLQRDEFPFERYLPLLILGEGASGSVYLARDKVLNKKVAVKVLASVEPNLAIDFQNEARATSSLMHSNIIKIFDFGCTEGGSPFMVLEYLPSVSLEDYLKAKGSVSAIDTVDIFLQLSEALSYAHASGVFHRDLKPSNILLTGTNMDDVVVKLIDFGVAQTKHKNQEPTIVQGRTIVGTPAYMSPDQVNGLEYDQRSELYSLGCVMYETLSGRQPFEGSTSLEVLRMHAEEEPIPVQQLLQNPVPEGLRFIIKKCMEKDPLSRYESMEELHEALASLFDEVDGSFKEIGSDDMPGEVSSPVASLSYGFHPITWLATISVFILLGFPLLYYLVKVVPPHPNRSKGSAKRVNAPKTNSVEFSYTDTRIDGQTALEPNSLSGNMSDDALMTVASDLRKEIKKHRLVLVRGKLVKDYSARRLDLNSWPIDGSGLRYLSSLPLVALSLSNTSVLDKNLVFLHSLPLQALLLQKTTIASEGIEHISAIDSLAKLDLSACQNICDEDLKQLQKLRGLNDLRLNSTKITDKGIEYLLGCKRLNRLELDDTRITDHGIKSLCQFENFEYLSINNCQGLSHQSLKMIGARFPDIKHLFISNLKIKPGQFREYLGNCRNLASANLIGVPIDDRDMEVIGRQRDLDGITLSGAIISDQSLKHFYNKHKLKHLALFNCPNLTAGAVRAIKDYNGPELTIYSDRGGFNGLSTNLADLSRELIEPAHTNR